eukprot:CAMPEP_0194035314 /NCGR_PEP_ID=MMETSP0009_2-20130614/7747_1 /TAXON_ID=210454 /ORGANISM="Grammatophora oceanica, Strain CCMP 410" /LENGTH=144 /DNA_ID=CAMNT_0038676615 /DNA_START=12 /DNA_END=443 /DNA_ORIENTATION=+
MSTLSRTGSNVVDIQPVRKRRKLTTFPTEKETLRFKFEDFKNLKGDDRNFGVDAPIAHCHGYRWQLCLYPALEDFTGILLRLVDVPKTEDPSLTANVTVRTTRGKRVGGCERTTKAAQITVMHSAGIHILRSVVLDNELGHLTE